MKQLLFIFCIFLYIEHTSWASENSHSYKLQAPLTTFIESNTKAQAQANAIQALIEIPDDAPSDLGVGAYVKDDDGNWFQLAHKQQLRPGTHHLHFSIGKQETWVSEPQFDVWSNYHHALVDAYGLFFWSEEHNNCNITIKELRAVKKVFLDVQAKSKRITNLAFENFDAQQNRCHGQTGKRWSFQFQIDPLVNNPYNSDLVDIRLHISGAENHSIPGFYLKPIKIIDGGDRDRCLADGAGYFCLRFRPRHPGTYQLQLQCTLHKNTPHEQDITLALPSLEVTGDVWDDYVRVDETDKRFFRIGVDKAFHWPLGMNIRSVTDPRGTQRTHSKMTPERIVHAYKAYFDRLSRAGANSAEIWMASWNVGLEWLDEWPGFHGIGAYHEGNAQRLDEILDYAYEKGLRIILVINNHGQASFKTDREWSTSPFNIINGGPLKEAKYFFTHEVPLRAQQERRRYIVARYGDHPAIMCWKLFSEMNLTDMARNGSDGPEQMRLWHKNAFDAWKALDVYDHPVTSHWSGDYRVPYRELVALENMDFTAIDAYHGRRQGRYGRLLANIMYDSTLHSELGLSQFNKPLVCTEFGASAGAGPEPQLIAEHMSGPWAALMSGHGSSPHLWWYEWTDQGDRWHPYRALSNYMRGEDFRSPEARCVQLQINHPKDYVIWSRAWFKPGTLFGYLLDWDWGYEGLKKDVHQKVVIQIGKDVKAGTMQLEWWDASTGHIIQDQQIEHQGGALLLNCPDFRRHLAFKLKRKHSQQ